MYPNLIDVPLQLMKHFQNPNSKSKQCVLVKQMGVLFSPLVPQYRMCDQRLHKLGDFNGGHPLKLYKNKNKNAHPFE